MTLDNVLEEIVCDAMGGMNTFQYSKEGKAKFLQEVQSIAENAAKDTGTGNSDTSQKMSEAASEEYQVQNTDISRKTADEADEWFKDGDEQKLSAVNESTDDIRYSYVPNATEYIPTGAERKSFESARTESLAKVKAKFDIVPAKWYVNINDYFYVFENASIGDYTIRYKVSTRNNTDIINQYKEEFRNGIIESTEVPDSWSKGLRVQRGYSNWHNAPNGSTGNAGRSDGLDGRKHYSDRTGDLQQSGGNQGSVPTYLGYTLKDIHAAIRWQKNLIAELDERRTEAYSALERKEAQRQYELSIDALSTLENYTDILSAKAFRNAICY